MRRKRDLKFANGYGGIVYLGERRRKPYAVRVTLGWGKNSRQLYKYIGYFERREDALACLVEFNKNPYDLETRDITFKKVYDEWSERHFEGIAQGTIYSYKTAIKKCEPLYKMKFSDIRVSHMQGIIDEHAPTSNVKVIKVMLKLMYDYALKHEIANKNYAELLDIPKKESKKKSTFTLEEINLLWKHENDDYAFLLLMLLYTGMRVGELLEIPLENVDFEKRIMIGGKKTEAGIDRHIPIHKKIAPLMEKRKHQPFFFMGSRSKTRLRYNNMIVPFKKYMTDLGIGHHTIHETRHTFISQCNRLELNKLVTKRIVGHSAKDITEHYTHVDDEDLIKAIDTFDY